MRYIEPEFLMRARAGDHALPVWDAAIVVFHSRTRSRAILERLPGTSGVQMGYICLTHDRTDFVKS